MTNITMSNTRVTNPTMPNILTALDENMIAYYIDIEIQYQMLDVLLAIPPAYTGGDSDMDTAIADSVDIVFMYLFISSISPRPQKPITFYISSEVVLSPAVVVAMKDRGVVIDQPDMPIYTEVKYDD